MLRSTFFLTKGARSVAAVNDTVSRRLVMLFVRKNHHGGILCLTYTPVKLCSAESSVFAGGRDKLHIKILARRIRVTKVHKTEALLIPEAC